MQHSLEALEPKQLKLIKSHLEQELQAAYSAKTIKKGFKLSPLQITNISFEVDELLASIKDKKQEYQIKMIMPFFEEGGYSYTFCSCQEMSIELEENRCHHMWLAQKQFLKSVETQLGTREVLSPLWQQMIAHLEPILAKLNKPETLPSKREKTILWELNANFECNAICAQTDEQGAWISYKYLTFTEFLKSDQYWQNYKYKGIAAMLGHELIRGKGGEFHDLTYQILSELANQQLDVIDEQRHPIRINKRKLSIQFRVESKGLRWQFPEFNLGADKLKVYQRGIAVYKQVEKQLFLFDLPMEGLSDFFIFLASNLDKTVEPKHVGAIFAQLSELQFHIALDFYSDHFRILESKPSHYIFLRITPLSPSGILVECLKCPLGSYIKHQHYLKPGSEPQILWNLDDHRSIKWVKRNLTQEVQQAKKLISSLKLTSQYTAHPYCFEIKDDLAAIEVIDRLNQLDDKDQIIVEWPADSNKKNYEIIEPEEEQTIKLNITEKNDWFFLKGGIHINGEHVSLEALLTAIAQRNDYVKLQQGKWLKITKCLKERLEGLDSFYESSSYEKPPMLRPSPEITVKWENMAKIPYISVESTSSWDQLVKAINDTSEVAPVIPESFAGSLRSYQKSGFEWLVKLSHWRMGGILADDMGLGKTIQTICFLLHRANKGASLILCPSSVTENWKKEVARFAPDLKTHDLRYERQICLESLKPKSLLICSYGLLLANAELLAGFKWNMVVFDEAQTCKNPSSKTYKAAKSLPSDLNLALSGTPIENNLQDLWTIFSLVNPALLGPWQQFKEKWIKDQEDKENSNLKLKNIISPFLLRRLKQDYLSELPPKTEKLLTLNLNQDERKLYDQIRTEAISLLTTSAKETSDGEQNQEFNQVRIKILSYLTKLRQMCSHPGLIEADWPASSSKMELFKEKALHLLQAGHKVLVFSQFPTFLKILKNSVGEHGARCLYLDGSTPNFERSKSIEQFQNNEADFFFISLKAGGTGVNLTQADYVFHMDPWWNPAVQAQATDRAYRMGQKNPVTIYRFICRHTVEETMTHLHKRKTELASELLSNQDQNLQKFDVAHLHQLLTGSGDHNAKA